MKPRTVRPFSVALMCLVQTLYASVTCFAGEVELGRAPFVQLPRFEGHRISCYSFDLDPTGENIAFVVDFSGSFNELWTAHIDGQNSSRVFAISGTENNPTNGHFIFRPKYSSDGTKVAFGSTGKGGVTLHVLDLTTAKVSDVFTGKGIPHEVGWRNPSHLYVTRIESSNKRTLYTIATDGTELTPVISGDFDQAYPSPDWSKICLLKKHTVRIRDTMEKCTSIEIVDVHTMGRKEIVAMRRKFCGHHPVWSPDNTALLFQSESNLVKMTLEGECKTITNGTVCAWPRKGEVLFSRGESLWKLTF